MFHQSIRFFILFALTLSLGAGGVSFAGVDDLAKQADKIIRNAERNMFNGKNAEADEMLKEAAVLIDQGKADDPGNSRLMRAEKKFERIRKQLDRKLGVTGKAASSSRPALPKKPEPKPMTSSASSGKSKAVVDKSGDNKLPGGVKKRLRDITRHLDSAERYAQKDAKQAKYKLQQAQQLFGEIERMYGGQFESAHPDYAAVKARYDSIAATADALGAAEAQAKADAAGAEAAKKKQSAEWVEKFRTYLAYPGQQGHDPNTLVFVPGTSEPEKFGQAQKNYEAFKAFYEEYKKTEFPHGKTYELENIADNEAPLRLKEFEEGMASRMDSVAGYAEKEIDAAMAQLEKDNGWKSDRKIKPNLVDARWMSSISDAVQKVQTAMGGSPQSTALQAKFAALVAKDKENRQIRKERTFMTPDRYRGKDLGALKKKAEALVKNDAKEGGDPLRTTIISENWREETVEEWTDTSRTTWRKRTTRHLTAQVAAKTRDGVRLITVALAKDKQGDGSWGPLYGNLHQYSDPMLESNVSK
jgi:hypothetical protein